MEVTQGQKGGTKIGIGICIVVLLVIGLFIWFSSHKSPTMPPTTTTNQPQIKETNFSPGTPTNQETAILVQHSDSAFEKFLVANSLVNSFVTNLPEGDKIVSQTPLK